LSSYLSYWLFCVWLIRIGIYNFIWKFLLNFILGHYRLVSNFHRFTLLKLNGVAKNICTTFLTNRLFYFWLIILEFMSLQNKKSMNRLNFLIFIKFLFFYFFFYAFYYILSINYWISLIFRYKINKSCICLLCFRNWWIYICLSTRIATFLWIWLCCISTLSLIRVLNIM
jgi:hypothetical protein